MSLVNRAAIACRAAAHHLRQGVGVHEAPLADPMACGIDSDCGMREEKRDAAASADVRAFFSQMPTDKTPMTQTRDDALKQHSQVARERAFGGHRDRHPAFLGYRHVSHPGSSRPWPAGPYAAPRRTHPPPPDHPLELLTEPAPGTGRTCPTAEAARCTPADRPGVAHLSDHSPTERGDLAVTCAGAARAGRFSHAWGNSA